MLRLLIAVYLAAATAAAQSFFPLDAVEAGQKGVGKTVFSGQTVEEFDVEILGVLENVGPKQSLILARLSGGPLARTGVMAGMSGSPVYIDGRLAGAVAFTFPFSTEPLCGIRPIEDMVVSAGAEPQAGARRADLQAMMEGREPLLAAARSSAGESRTFEPIATPVSFGGFTERALEAFGDQFRALGMRPLQGVGGTARGTGAKPLEPGSMISVGLMRGDLNMTAAGTVTHVDGDRVYGFGHPFLSTGPMELPMMSSSVIALAPNLQNSFKLAGDGELIGKLTLDRSAGIVGEIGPSPRLIPLRIRLSGAGEPERAYQIEIVRDRFLTPFLLQVATYAAVDATERQIGPGTLTLRGAVQFAGDVPALSLDNVYTGATAVGMQASIGTSAPLAYILQSSAQELDVDSIDVEIISEPKQTAVSLVRAWTDKAEAKPGETVRVTAVVRMPDGSEQDRSAEFRVPEHFAADTLQLTVSDANRLNILEYPALLESGSLEVGDLVRLVDGLRRADGLYLRVWKQGRTFRIGSQRLESPPAWVRAVLENGDAAASGAGTEHAATLSESLIGRFDGVVDGAVSLQLKVSR